MTELLVRFGPTLMEGTRVTLYIVGLSTLFSYLLGLPMGVALYVTSKGGILENRAFNSVFGWVINILRSFPFLILMISIAPLTRLIVGKIIDETATIVPLVVAAAPFVARLVESSLNEIDTGVIEAAKCMGATNSQIILRVMLVESVPSLVRGVSITTITLIGYSAMAGIMGAGGLGDIAIRYGLHRYQTDVMTLTIVLLIAIVCVVQILFDRIAKGIDKRNR